MTAGMSRPRRRPKAGHHDKDGQRPTATEEDQSLKNELRLAGLLPTRPRLLLARLLKNGDLHYVSPETLHLAACSSGAKVTLQTCYSTLEALADHGLVRRLFFGRPRHFYDANPDHQGHIYFEDTGELCDLPDEWLSVAQRMLGDIAADRINLVVWISRSSPA